MIFLNRSRRGPDPYLDWRVKLLFAGGGVALVGLALDSRILVGVAIGILALGMGLRFAGGKDMPDEESEPPVGTPGARERDGDDR